MRKEEKVEFLHAGADFLSEQVSLSLHDFVERPGYGSRGFWKVEILAFALHLTESSCSWSLSQPCQTLYIVLL